MSHRRPPWREWRTKAESPWVFYTFYTFFYTFFELLLTSLAFFGFFENSSFFNSQRDWGFLRSFLKSLVFYISKLFQIFIILLGTNKLFSVLRILGDFWIFFWFFGIFWIFWILRSRQKFERFGKFSEIFWLWCFFLNQGFRDFWF